MVELISKNLAGVVFCSALLVMGGAGCGKKGARPTRVDAGITAVADLNPDAHGRPSPVVVRVYELKTLSVFENADFYALYDEELATLGADLLAREELEIRPGEKRKYERTVDLRARYLGVIAAFRDLENARWRSHVKLGGKKRVSLQITLDRAAVSVDVPQ